MTNTYKVKALRSGNWRDYSECRLDVSINNDKLTGQKLEALIAWINANFNYCFVNIGDSLHCHNLMAINGLTEAKVELLS